MNALAAAAAHLVNLELCTSMFLSLLCMYVDVSDPRDACIYMYIYIYTEINIEKTIYIYIYVRALCCVGALRAPCCVLRAPSSVLRAACCVQSSPKGGYWEVPESLKLDSQGLEINKSRNGCVSC